MKIMHIAPNSYPFLGGIEILLKNFSKYVIGDSDFQHIISFPDRSHKFDGEFKVEGTRVVPLKVLKQKPELPYFPKPKYRPSEIAKIFALYKDVVKHEKPDILHFHDYSEASLPILSVARSLGVKRLHHLHTLIDDTFPKDLIKNLFYEENFLAVSNAVANSIKSQIRSDLSPIVIANGLLEINKENLGVMQEYEPTILMGGRCVPSKGFDFGIKVFSQVLKEVPNAKLILAGFGKLFNQLKVQVESLGISNSVQFVKGPHPLEVQKLILRSWIVFTPSQNQEGFNLVAAEAGLCGRPVVATNVGGLPETVLDGKTGKIFEPQDLVGMKLALIELLQDSAERQKLGNGGILHTNQNYSMEKFASNLHQIYRMMK